MANLVELMRAARLGEDEDLDPFAGSGIEPPPRAPDAPQALADSDLPDAGIFDRAISAAQRGVSQPYASTWLPPALRLAKDVKASPVSGGVAPTTAVPASEPVRPKSPLGGRDSAAPTRPPAPAEDAELADAQRLDALRSGMGRVSDTLQSAFSRRPVQQRDVGATAAKDLLARRGEAARQSAHVAQAGDDDPTSEQSQAVQAFIARAMPGMAKEMGDSLGRLPYSKALKVFPFVREFMEQEQTRTKAENEATKVKEGREHELARDQNRREFDEEQKRLDRAAAQGRANTMAAAQSGRQATMAQAREDEDTRAWSGRVPDGTRQALDSLNAAESLIADMGGLEKVKGVGVLGGLTPRQMLDPKSAEVRRQLQSALVSYRKSQAGASLTPQEKAELDKAVTAIGGGASAQDIAQTMKLLRQLANSNVEQALAGAPQTVRGRILPSYQPPDTGPARITVTNGTEELEISEDDLADAEADGFRRK